MFLTFHISGQSYLWIFVGSIYNVLNHPFHIWFQPFSYWCKMLCSFPRIICQYIEGVTSAVAYMFLVPSLNSHWYVQQGHHNTHRKNHCRAINPKVLKCLHPGGSDQCKSLGELGNPVHPMFYFQKLCVIWNRVMNVEHLT